jgi:TRAP-type C4-dicarboxylate transport system permease small subunit
MEVFLKGIRRISIIFYTIAGGSLTFLMAITILDVILRYFRRPIPGTYELVGFAGAFVVGFAIPFTSWIRGHVYVDFIIMRLPRRIRNAFNIATRFMVIILFFFMGWNLMKFAIDLSRSGEVSVTLQLPFYPFTFAVGICCLLQCLVMLSDIIKIIKGIYE